MSYRHIIAYGYRQGWYGQPQQPGVVQAGPGWGGGTPLFGILGVILLILLVVYLLNGHVL
jgi:hypothetical protein